MPVIVIIISTVLSMASSLISVNKFICYEEGRPIPESHSHLVVKHTRHAHKDSAKSAPTEEHHHKFFSF